MHASKSVERETSKYIDESSDVEVNQKSKVSLLLEINVCVYKSPLFLVFVHFKSGDWFFPNPEVQQDYYQNHEDHETYKDVIHRGI